MDEVFKRMKKEKKFRGVITEVVVEALKRFLRDKN